MGKKKVKRAVQKKISRYYLIGLVIILAFGCIGWLIYNIPSNDKELPTYSRTIAADKKITDQILLKLPSGWTQKVTSNNIPGSAGQLQVISSDLADGCCGGPKTNAVKISFEVDTNGKSQTFESIYKAMYDEINDPNPGGAVSHSLTRTTLAGYPAISFFYDFEGHKHTYYLWNGYYLWNIEIWAPTADQEEQYKDEIDSILSSIQFLN